MEHTNLAISSTLLSVKGIAVEEYNILLYTQHIWKVENK